MVRRPIRNRDVGTLPAVPRHDRPRFRIRIDKQQPGTRCGALLGLLSTETAAGVGGHS